MVKNIDVLRTFVYGGVSARSHTGNLVIAGNKLFNYYTCIAERFWNGSEYTFKVNVTKYSKTTSTIQNKLLNLLKYERVEKVDNVPIGAKYLVD